MKIIPQLQPLADVLFEFGAIKFGAFKLKLHETNPNAPLSPFYLDLRGVVRNSRGCSLIVTALNSELIDLPCDLIADIPQSISPAVANLMETSKLSMITPRIEKKDRGTKSVILGDFKPGQKVVLIDDLITKAESKFEVIVILEAQKLQVRHILVLVDREQGGAEQLAEKGYILHSVFKLRDLLEYYLTKGYINQEKHDRTVAYINAN